MPSSSRIIAAEEIAQATPWQFRRLPGARPSAPAAAPAAHATPDAAGTPVPQPADDHDRALVRAGYDRGYRDGFEAGIRQAEQRQREREAAAGGTLSQQVTALVDGAREELALQQEDIARATVDLAIALARRVVGASFELDPQRVVPVVREALGALVDARSAGTVHLHPEDHPLVEAALGAELRARGLEPLPDGAVRRGGCVLRTSTAEVDATLEGRWQRVLEALRPSASHDGPTPDDVS